MNIVGFFALSFATLGNAPPDSVMQVQAFLTDRPLEVGQTYPITLKVDIANGWSSADAGIPKPLLQIDVPNCAELEGKVLTDAKELARNEYLQLPFERQIEPGANSVRFTLKGEPTGDEAFALNVLAYVTSPEGKSYFLRQRLELPIKSGATSEPADATKSDWGREDTLQIGQKAAPFTIRRADGSELSLSEFLGKNNVIVTTYRAHW